MRKTASFLLETQSVTTEAHAEIERREAEPQAVMRAPENAAPARRRSSAP